MYCCKCGWFPIVAQSSCVNDVCTSLVMALLLLLGCCNTAVVALLASLTMFDDSSALLYLGRWNTGELKSIQADRSSVRATDISS